MRAMRSIRKNIRSISSVDEFSNQMVCIHLGLSMFFAPEIFLDYKVDYISSDLNSPGVALKNLQEAHWRTGDEVYKV